ncbi:MAG: hypothetical protein KAR06_07295, partial [Deltaproteobacteria bacterium]|nr:hypothetical protein [Deltaproteobacteria bacterium]
TNLYVSSGSAIRKIVIATGEVTTIAGTTYVSGSIDGTGTAARFRSPGGITSDGTSLYITDIANNAIRKLVLSTQAVTSLAGSSEVLYGNTDGIGTAARFNKPVGVTTDGTNLYVTDMYNNRVRKVVIATGEVTTFAGFSYGYLDDIGTAARFKSPYGVTTDGASLFVTELGSYAIRKIDLATTEVTTIAGDASTSGTIDGVGSAARFKRMKGITTDGTNLYTVGWDNKTVRKIVIATGEVTTIAGSPGVTGHVDGIGSAARFYSPMSIVFDGTDLYVSEAYSNTIRKVVIATGEVTTIAGQHRVYDHTDGVGTAATFYYPEGITTDGTNLYVTQRLGYAIRKINLATLNVTTIAGVGGSNGSKNGVGTAARFNGPIGITSDGTSLFIAEDTNDSIRKLDP